MASLNEIAEILAERVGRQRDIPFQELLKPIITAWASRLTKNSLEKHPHDRRHFIVPVLMELEESSDTKCEDRKCNILKTKKKVPTPLRANNILFDFVGNTDRSESYDYINEYELQWLDGNKYTKNRKKYFYKGGHIYVRASSILEKIAIDFIPADISEVTRLCGESCYNDDMDFPIHPDLLQPLIQSILTTELRADITEEDTEVHADKEVN